MSKMDAEVKLMYLNFKFLCLEQRTNDLFNILQEVYINKNGSIGQNVHNCIQVKKEQIRIGVRNNIPSESLNLLNHEFTKLNPYFEKLLKLKQVAELIRKWI